MKRALGDFFVDVIVSLRTVQDVRMVKCGRDLLTDHRRKFS